MGSEKKILSIIVCTYNRANLLMGLLETLEEQAVSSGFYEILMIDNNSSDNTEQVSRSFTEKYKNWHYFFEAEQGLSHARNRGWKEAKGDYVGYIDDDCLAQPNWIQNALSVAETMRPGMFGGPYTPFYLSPKPNWFDDAYGAHVISEHAKCLNSDEYLDGGNLFIRKGILRETGGFKADFGMVGNRISYGEETYFQIEIRKKFPDEVIYYDPALAVQHLVAQYKMKILWIIKSRFVNGRDYYRLKKNTEIEVGFLRLLCYCIKTLLLLGLNLTFGTLTRDRKQYPYFRNYFYEHALKHFGTLGSLWEQIRGKVVSK